jgi:hypothetical protein
VPTEAARAAIRERSAPGGDDPRAERAARAIAERSGGAVEAVVFFGSRRTAARPDDWSAYDFFVVHADGRTPYRAWREAGLVGRPALLLRLLDHALPPNQLSVRLREGPGEVLCKCGVLSASVLERATGPRRRDHFVAGRLFQPVTRLWSAGPAAEERVLDAVVSAHEATLAWARPYLPEEFDVEAYCRTLLDTSFRAEVRPEPGGRTAVLWSAQEGYLRPVYGHLLSAWAAAGEVREVSPGRFRLARPVSGAERRRWRGYFRRSLARATLRWGKHVVTFEEWLAFLLRKAERHTGQRIVLSARERRFPLLFLWPRVVRYLRQKDGRA